ncbi:hypothetical protein TraAM80_01146 [Trypanosoma rangeli]|uniref:Uncharacterized protein n=1 Tax=Trypanosoma rangeli TaxID=5698 RepID=A0A3R7RR11_TRYRA|nr:uncharacterized protein TraAM80_01146 [Trypanosoma rangeli]RNF11019.1 hypothetical protein TraAM80_01146 [Trypanosoma rangeli]|eukprot:RNF11019.1 hypothetical protein TraAM80_01146 [Trypanosoma rangeli]
MVYKIPPRFRTPLTQMDDTAAAWIHKHFAARWEAVRQAFFSGGVSACVPPAGAVAEQPERQASDDGGAYLQAAVAVVGGGDDTANSGVSTLELCVAPVPGVALRCRLCV